MERHGAMGAECFKVFDWLAKASADLGLSRPVAYWRMIASVACQKANAKLIRKVLEHRHLRKGR